MNSSNNRADAGNDPEEITSEELDRANLADYAFVFGVSAAQELLRKSREISGMQEPSGRDIEIAAGELAQEAAAEMLMRHQESANAEFKSEPKPFPEIPAESEQWI